MCVYMFVINTRIYICMCVCMYMCVSECATTLSATTDQAGSEQERHSTHQTAIGLLCSLHGTHGVIC